MPEKRYQDIKTKLVVSSPKIIKNLIIGFLIWVFGALIFLPLGSGIFIFEVLEVSKAVSAIILFALAVVFFKIVKHVVNVSEALAILAVVFFFGIDLPKEKEERYVAGFKKMVYVLITLFFLMIFFPLFAGIFKTLAALALLGILLWTIIVLFELGDIFSDKIDEVGKKFAEKLKEK